MTDEANDFSDLLNEERSRGRKRPIKAVSKTRERQIRRVAGLLRNPKCTFDAYLDTIREFGLPYDSDEYQQLLDLWKKLHGDPL